jgi:hypothetical protein
MLFSQKLFQTVGLYFHVPARLLYFFHLTPHNSAPLRVLLLLPVLTITFDQTYLRRTQDGCGI